MAKAKLVRGLEGMATVPFTMLIVSVGLYSISPTLLVILSIVYNITLVYIVTQLLLPLIPNFVDDRTVCKWSIYYRKMYKQASIKTKER